MIPNLCFKKFNELWVSDSTQPSYKLWKFQIHTCFIYRALDNKKSCILPGLRNRLEIAMWGNQGTKSLSISKHLLCMYYILGIMLQTGRTMVYNLGSISVPKEFIFSEPEGAPQNLLWGPYLGQGSKLHGMTCKDMDILTDINLEK